MRKKKTRSGWPIGTVVSLMLMSMLIGAMLTLILISTVGTGSIGRLVSEDMFTTIRRFQRLKSVLDEVETYYYTEPDEEALMTGAIRGLLASLNDPYTYYYTPEEMAASDDSLNGVNRGFGLLLKLDADGVCSIGAVEEGSPAEQSGLQTGDIVTSIDGVPLAGDAASFNTQIDRLKDDTIASAAFTILRNGEEHVIEVTRGEWINHMAEWRVLEEQIGYIHIAHFSGDAVERFDEACTAFLESDVTGLIVDLRDDPGGLLDDAIAIADRLLPEGVVTTMVDRNGDRTDYTVDGEWWDIPLVILVNGNSASASELFAGACQAIGRATIVGTQTYGKGIAQTLRRFSDGAGVQLTTARYELPDGTCLHGTGLTPDYIENDSDTQLQIAIELLRS